MRSSRRLGAYLVPLGQVGVRPDVHPLVQPADVAVHTGGQRRKLFTVRNRRPPDVQHLGDGAVLVLVNPHLVHLAQLLPAAHGPHKRRRMENLRLHMQDGALAVRGPVRVFAGGGAHFVALVQAFVRPDVDHLVQRADFGMEKGGQLGILLPVGQRLGESVLKNGNAAGLQVVSANFVNHRP